MEDFDIKSFLRSAVASGASDVHMMVDQPAFIRKNGQMRRVSMPPLKRTDITNALLTMAPPTLVNEFNTNRDIDFMYAIPGCSRFRVNYSRGLGNPGIVIRNIPETIPTLEELGLPEVLKTFTQYQNGLVIVTGPTGSGKSTTLASIINDINTNYSKNIITIEDPIEYIYTSRKSKVFQRQIGVDTSSYQVALRYALRQDPDVIFIGEIRDRETMETALKAAETGHLVFATLHTNDAVQSINRIIDMFEESHRALVVKQIAECLRATVAQKLILSEVQQKRYPACEIMIVTPTIKDYIIKQDTDEIYNLIENNSADGMISMNKSLADLVKEEKISEEEALFNSNDQTELSKMLRGVY